MSEPTANLGEVLKRIDQVNSTDPRMDATGEHGPVAKELLYGQRMSRWLKSLAPIASDVLQIACRGQHIARWQWPRSEFPEGRAGYKAWRRELYERHATAVSEIMEELGFDSDKRVRVAALIGKENRKTDHESQTLEDVACLVFLEFEFAAFAEKHDRAKLIRIVQKTWAKMSEQARDSALRLELSEDLAEIVKGALS